MSAEEDLAAHLAEFLSARIASAQDLRITGLTRSGAGSSRENWPFDVRWRTGQEQHDLQLLLRRDPSAQVVETERSVEFALLSALQPSPVPTPVVRWLDEDGSALGRPSIIGDRYEGAAHRSLLTAKDPLGLGAEGRIDLARDLAGVLADIHRIDVQATGIDAVLRGLSRTAEGELGYWVRELDRTELEFHPALRLTARWLRANLPPEPERPVLVHGDYRPANMLVRGGRIEVVLDWELAHTGDPLDDLGWYTTPLYRGEHFIEGSWGIDDFLAEYSARSGRAVDRDALKFWQVMAMFRLAVMAVTGIRSFIEEGSSRPAPPVGALAARTLAAIHAP